MTPTHDRLVGPRTALARLGDALAQPKTEWTRGELQVGQYADPKKKGRSAYADRPTGSRKWP